MRQYLQSHAQDELLKIYRREYMPRKKILKRKKPPEDAPFMEASGGFAVFYPCP